MSLTNLNDISIDLKKISYVGKPDTHVKSHINVIIHFFIVVVDGYPIEIQAKTREDLDKIRIFLLDLINGSI